jgi:hypothetical protein
LRAKLKKTIGIGNIIAGIGGGLVGGLGSSKSFIACVFFGLRSGFYSIKQSIKSLKSSSIPGA